MTYHSIFNMNNTTGATSRAEAVYHLHLHSSLSIPSPLFRGILLLPKLQLTVQCLVDHCMYFNVLCLFVVVFFVCLFVCLFGCFYFYFLSFCFIFVLLLLLLLSVCRFTASDYPFLIFKLSHITEIELYSPINLLLIGVYALTSNIKIHNCSFLFKFILVYC